ncbi:type III polyketide synthase [Microbispora sp. NEAU-D428]|uniref:type III polyketide synthase n=1 Tax=Microbispora sitophila TaxID=2771537 RepID=UPI0018692DFF|nr:type III polyketide synthase [Microbispora sitophila]MBE3012126.1 type III polyketide synthase [Microbispora sitophila]
MSAAPATRPTLLSIASAFPPHLLTQEEMYEGLLKGWYEGIASAEKTVFQTRVRRRRMAWDPREALADGSPGTGDRIELFSKAAAEVGGASVGAALEGQDVRDIGSFAMASCTGYTGPTPDLHLARRFGLRSDLRRTFVGHMGCFAAFNVLKVALDAIAARPEERVLVNCTEFNSLHFRPEATLEQAVIHGLFGDASVSAVLGSAPDGHGLQFLSSHTEQLYDGHEMMTWNVKNDGFFMTLSPYVPFVLAEHIESYLNKLLAPEGLTHEDIPHWVIHPGGPKILELLAAQLHLTREQLRASWHVLEEYGNCASGTVLLVLEDMMRKDRPQPGEFGVMLAFGPGLTIEGMLLRF